MSSLRTICRLVATTLPLVGALTLPASAQIRSEPPLSADDNRLVLSTLDQRLALPAPTWAATGAGEALLQTFEAVFRTGDAGADLEIYPKGAVHALATEVYGAHVARDDAPVLTDYRDTILDGYARACTPGLVAFAQLGEDAGSNLAPLLMVCGAQRANSRQGEIMAVSMVQSELGLAMVYQQWRGVAFDPRQADQWPAKPEVIEARALALQAQTTLSRAN